MGVKVLKNGLAVKTVFRVAASKKFQGSSNNFFCLLLL
jgi:hypothetical protein